MERRIGEIFEYQGEWYQCLPEILICNGCAFKNKTCKKIKGIRGECQSASRQTDGVIFKKIEKVGEPFLFGKKLMQTYKLFTKPVTPLELDCFTIRGADNSSLKIEIKQNKEEMEENKLNLKPFDLEAAKAGKPVCTRAGQKARIICFDVKSETPIVALITTDDDTELAFDYLLDGTFANSENPDNDLMMLPEKKEGYVNVYKNNSEYSTGLNLHPTKETACEVKGTGYITTVRIEWEE